GGEDDDLGRRLRRAGVRLQSLLRWTYSYHLWHPREVSVPEIPKTAANAQYLARRGRLVRCRNGVVKRSLRELDVQIIGRSTQLHDIERAIAGHIGATPRLENENQNSLPEVEILFAPGEISFSGRAQCNILVALERINQPAQLLAAADIVVAPEP